MTAISLAWCLRNHSLVNNQPIWLEAHEARLRRTLDWLGITLPDDWQQQLQIYLNKNGDGMGVVKIMVSANNLSFTVRANPYENLPSRPGFVLAMSDIRRNESSLLSTTKPLITVNPS